MMSEMDEFDDLLGGGEVVVAPKRGRPTNQELERRRAEALKDADRQRDIRAAITGRTKVAEEEFLVPVSKNFLARVLHMDPMTVAKRLRTCKPVYQGGGAGGREVYYFHEALPYLVKPKMDIGTYLKTLNAADMPNSINKTFWEAERIKNRVLIETGEAWSDGDVLEVLGTVFMLFKDRIPLLTEGLRDAGLTDSQFSKLQGYTDQLQRDLYEQLVELPAKRSTLPRRASIDPGDSVEPGLGRSDSGGDE